jgi:hypothetical protein
MSFHDVAQLNQRGQTSSMKCYKSRPCHRDCGEKLQLWWSAKHLVEQVSKVHRNHRDPPPAERRQSKLLKPYSRMTLLAEGGGLQMKVCQFMVTEGGKSPIPRLLILRIPQRIKYLVMHTKGRTEDNNSTCREWSIDNESSSSFDMSRPPVVFHLTYFLRKYSDVF